MCLLGAVFPCPAEDPPPRDNQDLADLTLQELMQIEVATVAAASGFTQKVTEAPSAVTIITAEEIRAYGYQTLADVLAAARGFYVTTDRNYAYAGVRGFDRTGDYNDRILLLVDGHRLNDPYYEQAYLGHENPIDLELVERLEIVRGPGSAVYGANAFFGVINLVTKRPRDMAPVEASLQVKSFGGRRGQVSFARAFTDRAEIALSASRLDSQGRDLYFPEWDTPETSHGWSRGVDFERASHFNLKAVWGDWKIQAGRSARIKGNTAALFGTRFNDARGQFRDERSFAFVQYDHEWPNGSHLEARLAQDWYRYRGDYPYDWESQVIMNRGLTHSSARGFHARLHWGSPEHLLWNLGIEYINRYRQDETNFDLRPYEVFWIDRTTTNSWAAFCENQWKISPRWLFSGGLRLDRYEVFGTMVSPRLALIWTPRPGTPVKILAGRAFRAPNPYEWFYDEGTDAPPLEPETITTYEMVVEHFWPSGWHWIGSGYVYRIADLIEPVTIPEEGYDLLFNVAPIRARGLETEVERTWKNGGHVRVSYAYQRTRRAKGAGELNNSPRTLFKINGALPLGESWKAGGELQYQSSRIIDSFSRTGSCTLANLNLSGTDLVPGLGLSLKLSNLLDRRCYDPGYPGDIVRRFELDGRTWSANLSWRWK